jgi:hypothetical protein
MKTTENTINIYAVDKIIEISEMFKAQGMPLSSVTLRKTDIKMVKNELSVHGCDLDESNQTEAFILIDNDEKFHRMWFRLEGYKQTQFDNWKLYSESIEYKK